MRCLANQSSLFLLGILCPFFQPLNQGIGGIFAKTIEGSYSAVVGLPLTETEELLREFGVDTWRYRRNG